MTSLEVRGITKRFGALKAVDDVSFTVGAGEICGFIGPNGAGKTTTMRICSTLELPDKGDKGSWIREAFGVMKNNAKYPRLKAAVFWHERWQNSADEGNVDDVNAGKVSDLRVNSSPGAQRAYREEVADPFFVGEVQFR